MWEREISHSIKILVLLSNNQYYSPETKKRIVILGHKECRCSLNVKWVEMNRQLPLWNGQSQPLESKTALYVKVLLAFVIIADSYLAPKIWIRKKKPDPSGWMRLQVFVYVCRKIHLFPPLSCLFLSIPLLSPL